LNLEDSLGWPVSSRALLDDLPGRGRLRRDREGGPALAGICPADRRQLLPLSPQGPGRNVPVIEPSGLGSGLAPILTSRTPDHDPRRGGGTCRSPNAAIRQVRASSHGSPGEPTLPARP